MAVIRDEWLSAGLSTLPADRETAQGAVTELYRLVGEPPPSFEWVPSPAAAAAVSVAVSAASTGRAGLGPLRLRAVSAPSVERDLPVSARLASLLSRLRNRLQTQAGWHTGRPWLANGAVSAQRAAVEDALMAGTSIGDVLDAAVHDSLRTTLRDAVAAPLRAALAPLAGGQQGLTWYGQHEAYWVALFDVWRRTGLVTYHAHDEHELNLWVALARSVGWWWAGKGLVMMTNRPVAVHTEPLPGSWHGEQRLHCPDGPAIRYPDGHGLYVLHGTPVPAWVLTDPTIERISREMNVEVRRSAIERIGWEAYIRQAGLTFVASSADPGNLGSELRLYDLPVTAPGIPARVLLAVNGTPEPDGRRRQYGLSIPAHIDDPVEAAGWSYGLPKDLYSRLIRRT